MHSIYVSLRSFVILGLTCAVVVFGMSSPAAAAPPPPCVDAEVIPGGDYGKVRVKNNCSSTQRVKVIIAWGPDSECYVISPADDREHVIDDHTGPFPDPYFDGLVAC
jgi:hypothetical protein